MTRFIAFAADPEIRSALLARLTAHAADGTIHCVGDRWNGRGGTPAGCIAGSGDAKAFEVATGYPAGLGLLLDHLCAGFEDPRKAAALAAEWLGQAAPGSDLAGVPSRLILFLLGEGLTGVVWSAEPRHILEAVCAITTLHHRAASGDSPTRADWQAVRATAIAATDTATSRIGKACGELAEAAAWDPIVSRSTLADVALKWRVVQTFLASRGTGWTDHDDAAFDACTQVFGHEILAHDPSLHTTDFPPFFRAREPELHDRYVRQLERSNVAFAVESHGALVRATLETVAVASRPRGA